ncbi:N-acetylmuramate alpha-1-phosphate uridylyltransferase MurU [Bordetella bronchialis]|uniref:Mannose-1-phosphate guanylyltransferase n=1 Tax=Bordetella bronchialis TaxID=463025 RepID=A0A193FUX2_9BORD|nr:nucleotidyltransferase family protein [Bordetella bronchialis]ANN65893.1 mannose-1-phosphate guanylyltransferase [Bordetella bronchialis]ANN70976.1 mannose-1-phosphate guanylyltransferase [Bordetella bronchialis]
MRAMILAAGRGERMRPLTDSLPKPLLQAGGKPLIGWHIERLVAAGITDIVVNHAWLGDRLEAALGDGAAYGARLRYSREGTALETAGGIALALPMLGDRPFLVVNGDVWCDWNPALAAPLAGAVDGASVQAWLLLVDNPDHHPGGDFHWRPDGTLDPAQGQRLTFSGIGIYHPGLFSGIVPGTPARLGPLLSQAIARHAVRGQRHAGRWMDVGTPQRLAELDANLRAART